MARSPSPGLDVHRLHRVREHHDLQAGLQRVQHRLLDAVVRRQSADVQPGCRAPPAAPRTTVRELSALEDGEASSSAPIPFTTCTVPGGSTRSGVVRGAVGALDGRRPGPELHEVGRAAAVVAVGDHQPPGPPRTPRRTDSRPATTLSPPATASAPPVGSRSERRRSRARCLAQSQRHRRLRVGRRTVQARPIAGPGGAAHHVREPAWRHRTVPAGSRGSSAHHTRSGSRRRPRAGRLSRRFPSLAD